jgi:hypothetical protein
MFANPTKVGISHQVVATLVAVAVTLLSIGVYATAQAANLTSVSNTLGTSEPAVTSTHFYSFTIPAAATLLIGETVTIRSTDSGFNYSTVVSGDITVRVNGGAPVAVGGFAASATQISFNNVSATAGQVVTVAIADNEITNPAVGSYQFEISAGGDTAETEVAIVATVLVTASVDTSFTFRVLGTATSTSVNGTSTTGSTTPTTIPFGLLVAGQTKTLAQDLTVVTNARNGFNVTVETDGNIRSSNGADIDSFANGTDISAAGSVWNSNLPTTNVALENTWGHWGLTYEDNAAVDLGSNEYIAASTTPRTIFSHTGPADGTTANVGSTTVGYQVRITGLQEAANDYQAILTYIATPVF